MRRISAVITLTVIAASWPVSGQPSGQARSGSMLTIDSIMRGPKLVGSPPSAVRWSRDSSKIYFTWQKASDSRSATYVVGRDGTGLKALTTEEARVLDVAPAGRLDRARRRVLTAENGDIVSYDATSGERRQLTRTSATESSPRWIRNDTAITFMRDGNLFLMALEAGTDTPFLQLTDIVVPEPAAAATGGQRAAAGGGAGGRGAGAGTGRGGGSGAANETESQRFLREQERALIDFIRRQAEQRQEASGRGGRGGAADSPVSVAPIPRFSLTPRQTLADLQLSTDERFVWIGVTERPDVASRGQDTPNYVTESAYPEMISGRTNVGDVQSRRLLAALDRKENKTVWADGSSFAGAERKAKSTDPDAPRLLNWGMPEPSDDGSQSVMAVRSADNKDRWLVKVDPASGKTTVLDTLHDDAWIRDGSITGTAAGGGIAWQPDNKRVLFMSEKSGFMHLYSLDVTAPAPQARALTTGKWEVTDARLSRDRKTMFLTTNEVHPGERHLYTMSLETAARTRVTSMTGSNEATVSPDEKHLAIVHSYSTKPPDLYVMPLQANAKSTAVTLSPTDEWRNFKWIDPKVLTYKARDGVDVYARLFTPEMIGAKRDPKKPAVIFVHGAGYLQNAHRYWSTYFREYMFHNLLASRGYVVLDPDYRASSGYGRDWRTAIYRHMGGHDLNDVVDGAKFLVQTEKVDPRRIGVYGGSYGGFITLMAMFTTPDVFAAGAALRPVTDWAHYNHGYTSNILNVPQLDPEAFKKSSPIYFAEGLKGRLLICHGMVDTNVFFQDSVRLVQRLIELRKESWEVAPYPVENHSFTEETSWADEYKRILKVFEETLRR
ncbi:MAG TPA: alpha/beta fold hydrolase [Vicinamibacterales bacterium]|nr:alpha/beta fold hydrolase [Vicinamibacterales bacterium]